jgi:hypothetical protein
LWGNTVQNFLFAQDEYDSKLTGTAKKVKGKLSEAAERWKWESNRLSSSALKSGNSLQPEVAVIDSDSIIENNRLPIENNRLPIENNRLTFENNRLHNENNRLPMENDRFNVGNNKMPDGSNPVGSSVDDFAPSRYDLFHYTPVRTPVTDYLEPVSLGEEGEGEWNVVEGGEGENLGIHDESEQGDLQAR